MKDPLGERMKSYEKSYQQTLPSRQPLILRLDGVHFHSLTKSFKKPWDSDLINAMNSAAWKLADKVQGLKFAYVQSDEISILSIDYENFNTSPWFGKKVQKIVSVAASIASVGFNNHMEKLDRKERGYFDCRVIPLVREEVTNYFIWRQIDCIRNSKLALGQHIIGKKKIHGMNQDTITKTLERDYGVNWNNRASWEKYGRVIKRIEFLQSIYPSHWGICSETPIFKKEREIIDNFLWPENEEGKYSTYLSTLARRKI